MRPPSSESDARPSRTDNAVQPLPAFPRRARGASQADSEAQPPVREIRLTDIPGQPRKTSGAQTPVKGILREPRKVSFHEGRSQKARRRRRKRSHRPSAPPMSPNVSDEFYYSGIPEVASDLGCLVGVHGLMVVQDNARLFISSHFPVYSVFNFARQKASSSTAALSPFQPMISNR